MEKERTRTIVYNENQACFAAFTDGEDPTAGPVELSQCYYKSNPVQLELKIYQCKNGRYDFEMGVFNEIKNRVDVVYEGAFTVETKHDALMKAKEKLNQTINSIKNILELIDHYEMGVNKTVVINENGEKEISVGKFPEHEELDDSPFDDFDEIDEFGGR